MRGQGTAVAVVPRIRAPPVVCACAFVPWLPALSAAVVTVFSVAPPAAAPAPAPAMERPPSSRADVVATVLAYSLCSSLMLVVNKLAMAEVGPNCAFVHYSA